MATTVFTQDAKTVNRVREPGTYTFTEALALTNFGKFNYVLIFISGLVTGTLVLETTSIGFVLPIAQCELQLTNRDKGILSAINFVGIIASSHLWGFFADTKGRRQVLWSTLLAAFVSTVFSSFAHNFWTMVLLRFINGFFVSSTAIIYAYLGEFHAPKTRFRAIMCSAVILSVVAMLLPMIAYLVINQDWVLPLTFLRINYRPWRVFLIVCGVPGLLCSIIIYILPESPKFLLTVGEETKAIQVLQKMHRWNNGKETLRITHILPDDDTSFITPKLNNCDSNSNFALVFLQTMWSQTAPLFQRKYFQITVIICNIQFWALVAANGLYMWFPQTINGVVAFIQEHPGEHKLICEIVYDQQETLYKTDGTIECVNKLETHTFYYSLIMEILYASSFALVGFIINRVGKILILFITIILFTSCGLASVFIVNPVIAAYLYVLFFVVGVAIIVLNAITVDLYPTHLRAMAACISLMVGRVGSIAGANVAGALMGQHCEWNFYICCGALFICAFLALLLPRKKVHGES
ncbi:synaptic vesicle glycoprotein 2A-like isoform X1 [Bactrocera neohumeralis]|uniref:synaptic vesicle glycoprotein 2A-like isoform X1 n=1 Tax=Bactrocera neohumeralis TaxID=98809 RepID=UPI002164FB62|nr:synaptic vesicle glycoprotein 2A-like isoform X1 [Bactrocera neohumeralis]